MLIEQGRYTIREQTSAESCSFRNFNHYYANFTQNMLAFRHSSTQFSARKKNRYKFTITAEREFIRQGAK
jgi:hypothetical protein